MSKQDDLSALTQGRVTESMRQNMRDIDACTAEFRTKLGLDHIDISNHNDQNRVLAVIALAGILVAEMTYRKPERREASMALSKAAMEVSALCHINKLDEMGGATNH